MAKKTEKFVDGTTEYTITQLGGRVGGELFDRLFALLAPVLTDAMTGAKANGDAEALVAGLLVRSMASLPIDLKKELVERFIETTQIKLPDIPAPIPLGTESVYDNHFAGNMGGRQRWFMFCMRLNFASFLGDMASSAASAAVALAS